MFRRFRVSIILAFLMMVVLDFPVLAGGWAVITLDQLPTNVVTDEPLDIGFTVLQHGKTPLNDLNPTVTARLTKSESFVVYAKPDGKPGHYTATLTFPNEGNWEWSIQAFSMDQPMPVLQVAAGSNSTTVPLAESTTRSISLLWMIRVVALVLGFIGLVVASLYNNRKALALTGLCLVVGVGSFVTGSTVPEVEAQSKSQAVELISESPISLEEAGQQLFIAKGCVTCHVNHKTDNESDYRTIDIGAPDLSNFSADPGYLDKWLFKPSALKPTTQMPDLNLSETERVALIAFINSK